MCQNCGATTNADGTKLKKCQKCKKIRYCSIPCQKDDHDRHKPECRAIAKAKELKNHGLVSSSMEGETKSASSPTTVVINQKDGHADSSSLSSSTSAASSSTKTKMSIAKQYYEQKITLASGETRINTYQILMTKDFTVKQTKGVLGDKSKTVKLKDKKFKSKAQARAFFKRQVASKTGMDQEFFTKKTTVTTPPKRASIKKKRKSKASAADGEKAKQAKKAKKAKNDADVDDEEDKVADDVASKEVQLLMSEMSEGETKTSKESEDVQFLTSEMSEEETKMSKESKDVQPMTAEMSEEETKTSKESKEMDTSGSLNIEKEEKMNCNDKKLTSGASCCVLM